ncbi:MAG: hypothetical protein ACPGUD_13395 [Parashewanella sp.]
MRRFVLLLLLILSGCDLQESDKPLIDSPEQITIDFFTAIYVDRNVQNAKKYVTPQLSELITHYHLASQIQIHLLDLPMEDVELEIDEIDIDFFRKFTDEVTVKINLKGTRNEEDYWDDRTIRLHKYQNTWKIVEIMQERGRF